MKKNSSNMDNISFMVLDPLDGYMSSSDNISSFLM